MAKTAMEIVFTRITLSSSRRASCIVPKAPLHFRTLSTITSDQAVPRELQLWAWGRAEAGQLGVGDENTRKHPHLLDSHFLPRFQALAPAQGYPGVSNTSLLKHEASSSIAHLDRAQEHAYVEGKVGLACGLFHSCVWANGSVWMWGKGDGGRLGLGSELSMYVPTLVESMKGVKSVALGGLHSVILTKDGAVYTWFTVAMGDLVLWVMAFTKESFNQDLLLNWNLRELCMLLLVVPTRLLLQIMVANRPLH